MSTRLARFLLAIGLGLAGSVAVAQDGPPPPGVTYDAPAADAQEAPSSGSRETRRQRRTRTEIQPYLEIAQGISTDFDGDTLTYTTLAVGVDGRVQTRRVTAQLSYRYDRLVEWSGDVGDQDVHSGLAAVNVQVVPGALQLDAGALATRTAGEGRALGVTDRDGSVEVYSVYAGPTLSTQAGPVSVNASYRLGYVAVDDDSVTGGTVDDFESAVAHSATASVGMAPGQLPFGWTVGGGYARTESESAFDDEFEGAYVRADVVVPVSPTLALTAGVGYETIEASQLDVVRDANDIPVVDGSGRPIPDPSRPRLLTYDVSGLIYDAGVIWRPTPRTELQARAGHRYGGTTVVGSLTHQFTRRDNLNITVFDSVGTFGGFLINDLSNLPDDFNIVRNPITGNLGGCAFGQQGGGVCLDRSLQSIRGNSFRMRGVSLVVSGERGLWTYGVGAGYAHRRYAGIDDPVVTVFGSEEDSFGLFGSIGRRLSRTSDVNLDAYASWFDSDAPGFNSLFSTGASVSYSRRVLLDRLRLLAALGLDHSDNGVDDSTILSALAGLRYDF